MYQKVFPVGRRKPVEEIQRLLAEARRDDQSHSVTLGTPPFQRNWLNRFTRASDRLPR